MSFMVAGVLERVLNACEKIERDVTQFLANISERQARVDMLARNADCVEPDAASVAQRIEEIKQTEATMAHELDARAVEMYSGEWDRLTMVRQAYTALHLEMTELEHQRVLYEAVRARCGDIYDIWTRLDRHVLDGLLQELPPACFFAQRPEQAIALIRQHADAIASSMEPHAALLQTWLAGLKMLSEAASRMGELSKQSPQFMHTVQHIEDASVDDLARAVAFFEDHADTERRVANAINNVRSARAASEYAGLSLDSSAYARNRAVARHANDLIELIRRICPHGDAAVAAASAIEGVSASPASDGWAIPEADVSSRDADDATGEQLSGIATPVTMSQFDVHGKIDTGSSVLSDDVRVDDRGKSQPIEAVDDEPLPANQHAASAARAQLQRTLDSYFAAAAGSATRKKRSRDAVLHTGQDQSPDGDADLTAILQSRAKRARVEPDTATSQDQERSVDQQQQQGQSGDFLASHASLSASSSTAVTDAPASVGAHSHLLSRLRAEAATDMPLSLLVHVKPFWNFNMQTHDTLHGPATRAARIYIQVIGVRTQSLDTVLREIALFDTTTDAVQQELASLDAELFSRSDMGYVMVRLASHDAREMFTTFDLHETALLWRVHWAAVYPDIEHRAVAKSRLMTAFTGIRAAVAQKFELDPFLLLAVRGISAVAKPRVHFIDNTTSGSHSTGASKSGAKFAAVVACGWNCGLVLDEAPAVVARAAEWDARLYFSRTCDPRAQSESAEDRPYAPYAVARGSGASAARLQFERVFDLAPNPLAAFLDQMTRAICCKSDAPLALADFICITSDLVADSSAPLRDLVVLNNGSTGYGALPGQAATAAAQRKRLLFYPGTGQGTSGFVVHVCQRLCGDEVIDASVADLPPRLVAAGAIDVRPHVLGYRIRVPATACDSLCDEEILNGMSRQIQATRDVLAHVSPGCWRTRTVYCVDAAIPTPLMRIDCAESVTGGTDEAVGPQARTAIQIAGSSVSASVRCIYRSSYLTEYFVLHDGTEVAVPYYVMYQPNAVSQRAAVDRSFLTWKLHACDIVAAPIACDLPTRAAAAFQRAVERAVEVDDDDDGGNDCAADQATLSPYLHVHLMNPVSDNCVASATFEYTAAIACTLPQKVLPTQAHPALNQLALAFVQLIFPGYGMADLGFTGSHCVSAFEQLAFSHSPAYVQALQQHAAADFSGVVDVEKSAALLSDADLARLTGPICLLQDASTFSRVDDATGVRYCPSTVLLYLHRAVSRLVEACPQHGVVACAMCNKFPRQYCFYGRRGYAPVTCTAVAASAQSAADVAATVARSLETGQWYTEEHATELVSALDMLRAMAKLQRADAPMIPDTFRQTEFPKEFFDMQRRLRRALHAFAEQNPALTMAHAVLHLLAHSAAFYLDAKNYANRLIKRKTRGLLADFVLWLLRRERVFALPYWAKQATLESLQETVRRSDA